MSRSIYSSLSECRLPPILTKSLYRLEILPTVWRGKTQISRIPSVESPEHFRTGPQLVGRMAMVRSMSLALNMNHYLIITTVLSGAGGIISNSVDMVRISPASAPPTSLTFLQGHMAPNPPTGWREARNRLGRNSRCSSAKGVNWCFGRLWCSVSWHDKS